MGMILFLILACGFPGLMLLYIRQRVPDNAWAGPAVEPAVYGARSEPREYREGYLGGVKAEGSQNHNSDESFSFHGADIEHGLTSNTIRTDAKEHKSGSAINDSTSGRKQDKPI